MKAPPPEQPSLTVLSGPLGGTVFVVDESMDNVLVGSDPSCRFALPGTAVDPIHARLWIDFEGITVYDTDSPGGVYINDDRVQGQARLRNGDILWLGAPGDDKSVMLQCRMPSSSASAPAFAAAPVAAPPPKAKVAEEPPVIEPTIAMMASDLHDEPEPTISLRREAEPEPEPTIALAPDTDTTPPPPPAPPSVLAPDAIQPEPTVMMAPGDDEVLAESESTIAMMPEELVIAEDPELPEPMPEPVGDATAAMSAIDEPPPTLAGWDASAGGIPAAADPPWMQAAPPLAIPAERESAPAPVASAPAPAPAPPRAERLAAATSPAAAVSAASAASAAGAGSAPPSPATSARPKPAETRAARPAERPV